MLFYILHKIINVPSSLKINIFLAFSSLSENYSSYKTNVYKYNVDNNRFDVKRVAC